MTPRALQEFAFKKQGLILKDQEIVATIRQSHNTTVKIHVASSNGNVSTRRTLRIYNSPLSFDVVSTDGSVYPSGLKLVRILAFGGCSYMAGHTHRYLTEMDLYQRARMHLFGPQGYVLYSYRDLLAAKNGIVHLERLAKAYEAAGLIDLDGHELKVDELFGLVLAFNKGELVDFGILDIRALRQPPYADLKRILALHREAEETVQSGGNVDAAVHQMLEADQLIAKYTSINMFPKGVGSN